MTAKMMVGYAKQIGAKQAAAAVMEAKVADVMKAQELEAIRERLGYTQEQMANRLQCDFVGYRRYATGSRPIPRYIARCAELLDFIQSNGLKNKLEKILDM